MAVMVVVSEYVHVPQATTPLQTAPSTISVVDDLPPFTIPLLVPPSPQTAISVPHVATSVPPVIATSSATTSQPKVTTLVPSKPVVTTKPLVVAPVVVEPVSPPQEISQDIIDAGLNSAAQTLRGALVNIICYAPTGSGLHSMTGSGVVIDPKGIVLTNAHIAQYFLFADRGVSCRLRSGSPATDHYTAALLYLPSIWIQNNAQVLTQISPSGTGEYDFAFIGIVGSIQKPSTPLPNAFPALPLAVAPLSTGAPVVIGSYGAQFLEYSQIQSNLFPTLVFGSVKNVFTFATNSIDVVALGGSAAAQEGSSGGGVVNALGELAATITTSTTEGVTSGRQLNAITASYMRREYANETGESLDSLLSLPLATSIANFIPSGAALEAILAQYLP